MTSQLEIRMSFIPRNEFTKGLKEHLMERFVDPLGTHRTIQFLEDLLEKVKRDAETHVVLLQDVSTSFIGD